MSVFEVDDYKKFVSQWLKIRSSETKGLRRQLAAAAGCQVAYVSHVLVGDKHFSLEQAEAISRFMNLRQDEITYWLLLVERQRAGTPDLQKYFDQQLKARRREHHELNKQVRIEREIREVDQAEYYSSWHYQAVHSLLTIIDYNNAEFIADRLSISVPRVNKILSFLLSRGLIEQKDGHYKCTSLEIHLSRSSPLISKLHANWRIQTAEALSEIADESHHYSGLVTLSAEDCAKIRSILRKALPDSVEVVKRSKEEKLYLLAMDFYEV